MKGSYRVVCGLIPFLLAVDVEMIDDIVEVPLLRGTG